MRFVVTSDWHGDWSTLGHRRHAEVCEAVAQSVELAVAEKADVYVCLGDIADPDTGGDSYRTVALALRTALALRSAGIRSVWVRGNHDVCEDGTGACTMTPLSALEDAFPEDVFVATAPRLIELGADVYLLALPFMPASHGVDVAESAFRLFPRDRAEARVVVAAHLMLPGVHPGSETTEMPRGREVLFPAATTAGAALRLNGHYHARQIHDPGDGGPGIYIPGALARLTFGEEGNEPSMLVIDLPPPRSAS